MAIQAQSTNPGSGVPAFDICDRLRKARETTGLDQKAFAEELEIARATVGNYEQGRVTPRRIVLRAWALRAGVPLEWLLTGAGSSHEPYEANRQPID